MNKTGTWTKETEPSEEEWIGQMDEAQEKFISFVAHELRTPMTSIRGYADMLAKGLFGPVAPQQKEFIRVIVSNVKRMEMLLSNLEDMARIETGQLKVEVQPTHLADGLDDALRTARPEIKARSQQLTVEAPADLPPILADPTRISQILTNLLSNASKFTPEGGEITVQAWSEDGAVHCSVADTGIGISAEDRARLFTPFFRSEEVAVQDTPGHGLGLAIVKNLVALQGGEIQVESQPGQGSTFTVTIPLAKEEAKS